MTRTRPNRRVATLVYPNVHIFELGIVSEIFGIRRPELPRDWYRLSFFAVERTPIETMGGVRIEPGTGIAGLRGAGTIVIPGWHIGEDPPAPLLRGLRIAHERGARIISICSGAFVLAAAGLLDGKRATTHWSYIEMLRSRFPKVQVEESVLYVDEGSVLTSAGSAAGIDLGLHVVRSDFGAEVANELARQLVVPPHRDGGQAQYVRRPVPATSGNGGLARVLDWAIARIHQPLSVQDLAREANMSVRTFARRFCEEVGGTPHRWLTRQRLLAVQERLESTRESVDAVAEAVGFSTAMTLRHHFRHAYGISPTTYRRRFSTLQNGSSRKTN